MNLKRFLRWLTLNIKSKAGDWMDGSNSPDAKNKPASRTFESSDYYDADKDSLDIIQSVTMNPVVAFHEAIAADGDPKKCTEGNPFSGKKVKVSEAWIFEGRFDESGKLLKESKHGTKPYRIRHVTGNEAFKESFSECETQFTNLPARAQEGRAVANRRHQTVEVLRRAGLVEDWFGQDLGFNGGNSQYDPTQYTEYTPTVGGPFFKQLYLPDYLLMHARAFECISGDTQIPLLDGTSSTIKELSETGKNVWLYACDKDLNVVPALGINPHKVKTSQIVEVELDNGEVLKCTHDHPVMLRSGEFKNAGELKPGESLMPLYRRPHRDEEYEAVYHPGLDMWEATHHLVARKMHAKRFVDVAVVVGTKNRHVDHINEIKRDNTPTNLQILTNVEHSRKTHTGRKKPDSFKEYISRRNAEWKRSPQTLERMSESMKKAWDEGRINADTIRESNLRRVGEKRSDEFKAGQSERTRASYDNIAGLRELRRKVKTEYWGKRKAEEPVNHKVVSVRDAGVEDVYDISVPIHHNFAIGQGVFVHNCWNHNPIAKRVVNLISQYALGRQIKENIKDAKKKECWENFKKETKLYRRMRKFWSKEKLVYGEFMYRKSKNQSMDPSECWEIVTDPDDISNVYYYYLNYPTAYQLFPGIRVSGVPGSGDTKGQEYIVKQIPYDDVIHMKMNCVSNEKRGRSLLFPILGWLKRIKDLYNAEVTRSWLSACFIWDDTIMGSQADVDAHLAKYPTMPTPGTVFAHNEAIKRTPMAAVASAGARNTVGIGDEILALIATCLGMPKDYLNILTTGGGSRATALVGSEPFTKVIEEEQADWEEFLLELAEWVFEINGLKYEEGDIEFIFPSVSKDTTQQAIANIGQGLALGFISKRTGAKMYAAEMDITTYDFDDEMDEIRQEKEQGLDQLFTPPPPAGRTGGSPGGGDEEPSPEDQSPIHGQGAVDLAGKMNSI